MVEIPDSLVRIEKARKISRNKAEERGEAREIGGRCREGREKVSWRIGARLQSQEKFPSFRY